jgi:chemotaxis signal transduction protein
LSGVRALRLRIGEDVYAVPMDRAREVVAAPVVTALPTAPASVLGVCNVRGEILPVFDTGVLLGLGPTSLAAIAVVDTALGAAGLAMSDTGATVELGGSVAMTETVGTAGAFLFGSELAVLLDVEVLLSSAGDA